MLFIFNVSKLDNKWYRICSIITRKSTVGLITIKSLLKHYKNAALLPGKGVSLEGNLNFSEKWFEEGPGDGSVGLLLLGNGKELAEDVPAKA